jgi:hypothetical protein
VSSASGPFAADRLIGDPFADPDQGADLLAL